jgi:hypothetical protein
MGIIEEIWNGNFRPNLYAPDEAEKCLTERLDVVMKRLKEKCPDDSDINELIEISSRLMIQTSGRAFNEGIKFGFSFATEIRN